MNKKNLYPLIFLFLITILGAFLRFYKITQNPPSLTGDEISFGYSAYSVLKTGRDEFGKFLPFVFKSVGDYKNPLPVYLMVPVIKFFGLNEFAVRFPNAFLGTLSIPIIYFFFLDLLKDKTKALIGSGLLSISAWHIFYSRFSYETLMASLFVLIGIWTFIKMLSTNRSVYAIISAFFFTLTMYTAFAPRLFIPVFVALVVLGTFKKINWKNIIVFAIACLILGIPLIYTTLYSGAGTRMQMVFLGHDIEFARHIILKQFGSIADLPYLLFFWLNRFISYLNPSFLFFNGLDVTYRNPIGLGMFYLFELPLVVYGAIIFIKSDIPYKKIFVIWLLVGLLPDSLTNNQQHLGRLLHIFPVLILLSTLGLTTLIQKTKGYVHIIYMLFVVLNLIHAYLIISFSFPKDKGESFDEGLREAVHFVNQNQDKYKEIVFDPARGVDGPNMISNPFLYVLFYTKYDPASYQDESKNYSQTSDYFYQFNKYTFRHIDWPIDNAKKDTLFVGSPWSIPKERLKEGELLQTIYLSSGQEAFYIVNPK